MPATATRNGLLSAAHVAPPLMEMSMAPDEASFLHNEEPALTVTTTLSKTRGWGFGLSSRTLSALGRPVSTGATRACVSGSGRQASGSGEFRIFDPNGNALSTSAYGWTRLFQGREYIPMLDAYDFRARTLWPELGRFGQEDPAGAIDSTNRYQALGGRWNGVTDPMGLYEEDVHHYLTTFLARAAGFGWTEADQIGLATQALDMDSRDAMYGGGANHENMEKYHFVSQERLYGMRGKALSGKELDAAALQSVGEFLHSWEDSYSHQANPHERDFGAIYHDSIAGLGDIGHGRHKHEPDWTWKRVPLALQMAKETYEQIVRIGSHYLAGVKPKPYSQIEERVQRFVMFEPKSMFDDLIFGVTVPDVTDYTEKIRELDTGFSLTQKESEKRRDRYLQSMEREMKKAEAKRRRFELPR